MPPPILNPALFAPRAPSAPVVSDDPFVLVCYILIIAIQVGTIGYIVWDQITNPIWKDARRRERAERERRRNAMND